MAKSPAEVEATMIANLEEKSGKSLAQWLKIIAAAKLAKHGEMVNLLKSEYGVTHGYANLIAHRALAASAPPAAEDGSDLLAAQYSGAKAALRPIYDALMAALGKFGADVEVAPKKAYMSLRRSKQFAIIQPSTATRMDVGLQLKGVKPAGRLEASGSFSAMVSHRVRLEKPSDVDSELIRWLKQAYEAA